MSVTHFGVLQVEDRLVSRLKPFARNARTHSRKQIHQIAASIREFGFTNPVLIDQHHTIIAGHGRVEAAKLLGRISVPTIQIEYLTEAQKRAYVLADNKVAENAGWDPEILAIELQHLSAEELTFDLEITGFDTAEIDILIDGPKPAHQQDPADAVSLAQTESVTVSGDIWVLGDHRVICGDARQQGVCSQLFQTEKAQLMFADPPYNVPIEGHVGGLGSVKHREFAMAAGEMTKAEFTEFLRTAFARASEFSVDGAVHFICMDWRHLGEVLSAGEAVYSELKNLCVWNKDNGGMGSFYRSKHELIFVFKVGTGPHINTVQLGSTGRYRTNVWDYPGVNTIRPGRLNELSMHPTVKPVALVVDAIKDCSRRGDVVFDPFGGSGTTLIAAEKSKALCSHY
jgi:DNA modification methylase